MTAARRLLLDWDPELDSAFRRRLEDAFEALQIPFADAAEIDADPDAPATPRLAVASTAGRFAGQANADMTLLGGPGDAPPTASMPRLEAFDIDQASRRWIAVLARLGARLDRPGLGTYPAASASVGGLREWALAFPTDPLAGEAAVGLRPDVLHAQLAAERRRAETAEQALANLDRERADAVRDGRRADEAAGVARARIVAMSREIDRLTALSEASAYALSTVRPEAREAVRLARDHAWRARLAAARAGELADTHPDALAWPKAGATYGGETRNRLPHGLGVMVFRAGAETVATYGGGFVDGARAGHGIARSDDGHVWSGQWTGNEAGGFGLLETPDGRRFEGEVKPGADGTPQPARGWTWEPVGTPASAPTRPAHAPPLLLTAPDAGPAGI